jgi:Flp pilus assembly secretin CpaC
VAGLLDNESTRSLTKIPILGDIPILGELFKSRSLRQRRTELVVIVTPQLIMASDTAPPVPTGEPGPMPDAGSWQWQRHLRGHEKPGNPLQPGSSSSQPQQ